MSPVLLWALALVLLLVLAELAVRAVSSVLLFDADPRIGFIPRANQRGRFLGFRAWSFNDRHLLGGRFSPEPGSILLVGDSVVWGVGWLLESQRVGAILSRLTGRRVWSAAADGWGLRNELEYLRRFPEVSRGVSEVVFVLNSGDFGAPGTWRCEAIHPRAAPVSAVCFWLKRKIAPGWQRGTPADLKVPSGDWREEMRDYLRSSGKPVTAFLYPRADELQDPGKLVKLRSRAAELQELGVHAVFDVAADGRWSAGFYRDHIHPSRAGNAALAGIIAGPDERTRLTGAW